MNGAFFRARHLTPRCGTAGTSGTRLCGASGDNELGCRKLDRVAHAWRSWRSIDEGPAGKDEVACERRRRRRGGDLSPSLRAGAVCLPIRARRRCVRYGAVAGHVFHDAVHGEARFPLDERSSAEGRGPHDRWTVHVTAARAGHGDGHVPRVHRRRRVRWARLGSRADAAAVYGRRLSLRPSCHLGGRLIGQTMDQLTAHRIAEHAAMAGMMLGRLDPKRTSIVCTTDNMRGKVRPQPTCACRRTELSKSVGAAGRAAGGVDRSRARGGRRLDEVAGQGAIHRRAPDGPASRGRARA